MKEIIEQNRYKIKQIIKNITGEYNEDLEQETYLKTYLNLNKYKEMNKFSQWICTICANLCRDYLKSSKTKLSQNSTSDELIVDNLKAKDSPEKELSSKERQKLILKEINALPKKLKETIILYELEDFSYEQISKKLNIPAGTVKSRINSARTILREKLSILLGDDSNE